MKTKLLAFCVVTAAFSQDTVVAPLKWQWEGLHAVKLTGIVTPAAKIEDSKTTTAHSQVDLYAQVPVVQKEKNYFGSGVVYRTVLPQLELVVPDSLQLASNSAHSAQLLLAWWHKLGAKSSLYTEYNGGIAGLWDRASESQYHLAFAYTGFKPKPNRLYRTGVAVAYQFDRFAVYPLLGADLGLTDHFAIDFMFPTHAAARFRINEKLEFAAKAAYSLGGIGFETKTELPIAYAWSYFSGGAYGDYRIYKDLIFRIEGGEQFLRKIELKTTAGDSLVTLHPKPTPFASVSIRWQV